MTAPRRPTLKRRLRAVSRGLRYAGYAIGASAAVCMLLSGPDRTGWLATASVAGMGGMVICFALVYSLRMLAEALPDVRASEQDTP